MQYRYAQNQNFEDYASGRVIYNRPGYPAFPVRLASEIFQRALAHWQPAGSRRCSIYDPVCGGAYWLTVLAYLHGEAIGSIYASDIDLDVLPLAERNLSLITTTGLDQRISDIENLLEVHKKDSHADALVSGGKFRRQLESNLKSHAIETHVFQADAARCQSIVQGLGDVMIDLVLADVPYGQHSQWQRDHIESKMDRTAIWQMLDSLQVVLKPGAIVAVAADKNQKAAHEKYRRLERFQLGKRRVFILGFL